MRGPLGLIRHELEHPASAMSLAGVLLARAEVRQPSIHTPPLLNDYAPLPSCQLHSPVLSLLGRHMPEPCTAEDADQAEARYPSSARSLAD